MKTRHALLVNAMLGIVISACKKQDNTLITALGSEKAPAASVYTQYPLYNADSIDLNTDITIKSGVSARPGQILDASIILKSGSEKISGTLSVTANEVRFKPEKELSPNTSYEVTANITGKTNSDDTRRAGAGSNSSMMFVPGVSHFSFSWTFTTRSPYTYAMNRTSQWVTDRYRDGNKIIQMGDYLYCYGGWTSGPEKSYNDVYRSSGDLTEWEKLPDAPWESRHTYGIGKIDSLLYIFGGDYLSSYFDVWKSNDGISFSPVYQDVKSRIGPRILYGACVHRSSLFVLGGQSDLADDVGLNDIWTSINGSLWRRIASNLPFISKNISGSVASFRNRLWVVGGGKYFQYDGFRRDYSKEIYSSVDGITWQREADPPWLERQYADVVVWNNRLWMIGGYNEGNLKDIWFMDEDGAWHEFETPESFEPRHASGVAVYNDKLVIVCGNFHNDCFVIEKK